MLRRVEEGMIYTLLYSFLASRKRRDKDKNKKGAMELEEIVKIGFFLIVLLIVVAFVILLFFVKGGRLMSGIKEICTFG